MIHLEQFLKIRTLSILEKKSYINKPQRKFYMYYFQTTIYFKVEVRGYFESYLTQLSPIFPQRKKEKNKKEDKRKVKE